MIPSPLGEPPSISISVSSHFNDWQKDNSNALQHYSAYNCIFASDIELPELMPPSSHASPEISLHSGVVPPSLTEPIVHNSFYQIRKNTWLITAEDVAGARFLVREGCEIIVERVSPSDDRLIRLCLLGSCMGALLLQRGLVPFHGNAIATDRGAIILAGVSGAGKSTLTLALLQRGYRLLADDLSPVALKEGKVPLVQPGFPRLKLWADTCNRFGIDPSALSPIHPDLAKFHYPVGPRFCAAALPLHTVYILVPECREQPTLERLTGVDKIKGLQAQFYKMYFSEAQRNWPWLFKSLTSMACHAHICLIRRPQAGCRLDQLADLVTADLAAH